MKQRLHFLLVALTLVIVTAGQARAQCGRLVLNPFTGQLECLGESGGAIFDSAGNLATPGNIGAAGALNSGVGTGVRGSWGPYDAAGNQQIWISPVSGYIGTNTIPAAAPTSGQVLTCTTAAGNNCPLAWSPTVPSIAFASLKTCTSATNDATHVPLATFVYCTDCKNVTDDTTGTYDAAAAGSGHGTTVLCTGATPGWRNH